jgi:Arc/MetJ-type ribon-helix-helix transcriptional regulator
VKLSISLPPADVEFLDSYTHDHGFDSRSAAVQRAIRLLRAAELGDEYESAWNEWEESGDAELWEVTAGDGLRKE